MKNEQIKLCELSDISKQLALEFVSKFAKLQTCVLYIGFKVSADLKIFAESNCSNLLLTNIPKMGTLGQNYDFKIRRDS